MKKNILASILVLGAISMASVGVSAVGNGFAGQQQQLASHTSLNSTAGQVSQTNLAYMKVSTKKWHEKIMKILKDLDC